VAHGNKQGQASPILHCTLKVKKAYQIRCGDGRDRLYSNWLFRLPFAAISQAQLIGSERGHEHSGHVQEHRAETVRNEVD
jgi:hypothetical protein